MIYITIEVDEGLGCRLQTATVAYLPQVADTEAVEVPAIVYGGDPRRLGGDVGLGARGQCGSSQVATIGPLRSAFSGGKVRAQERAGAAGNA